MKRERRTKSESQTHVNPNEVKIIFQLDERALSLLTVWRVNNLLCVFVRVHAFFVYEHCS